MFNAFKYTKQLEEAGFSRAQAEIQLQVISEIVEGELATKQDLNLLHKDLTHSLQELRQELRHDIKQIEYRLTIKLGAFLTICFTTLITLMKFWLAR